MPLNINKVVDTASGNTYFVAKDLYNICNKYSRRADLPIDIQSKITETTFAKGTTVYVETSTRDIVALTCDAFNNSTSLSAYKITNK